MNDRGATLDDVACPFCGMLCEDLAVSVSANAMEVVKNGCARGAAMFRSVRTREATAFVDGRSAAMDEALSRAASVLRAARRLRFVSGGTDVAGARALVALAERCRATIEHANAKVLERNQRVLQASGWMATTLTEVRNRADLLVVAGTGVGRNFPRFFERCFGDGDTLFETGKREAWVLGRCAGDVPAPARSIAVDGADLAELFGVLRALLAGRTLQSPMAGGATAGQLATLIDRMRAARYGVLAWDAADFEFPHADLAVQAMCDLVTALNEKGRFSVLPLAGTNGDLSLQQVTTWQTGFSGRVGFRSGAPSSAPQEQGPHDFDAVLHVSTLDPSATPRVHGCPTIVLGPPGMPPPACEVFISVGMPGVHHAGHLHRADTVVIVPLGKVVPNALPSAASVLRRLQDRLESST